VATPLTSLLLALSTAVLAASPCPPPRPPAEAIGGDGTAWVIVRDEVRACLVAVDEDGAASLVTRWSLRGDGAPVALAALADGRAVLARPERHRWRLSTWDPRGVETPLPIWLPSPPDVMLAHPYRALVGIRMSRCATCDPPARPPARAWLVDIDAGSVAAIGSVPPDAHMRFPSDAAVLSVGSAFLVAAGVAAPSDAAYTDPVE
jgi:hypothetical protein